eukprot:m.201395 g.201395  ORF g.201395 m.201395 type:complete len:113 (+) comp16865_c0_seq4:3061-3399(+)
MCCRYAIAAGLQDLVHSLQTHVPDDTEMKQRLRLTAQQPATRVESHVSTSPVCFTNLCHGRDFHALQHVPWVWHAVLNGQIILCSRLAHLQQPGSCHGNVLRQQRYPIELIV